MLVPPDDLPGMVAWLARETAEMRRRDRNRRREGRIVEAKPAEGLYKVRFREASGDEPAFDGPWLKVRALSSGGLKIQAEPTVGQWVTVISESGELTDGVIDLSAYFSENDRPHDKNGELVITVGGMRGHVDADGNVVIEAPSGHLK